MPKGRPDAEQKGAKWMRAGATKGREKGITGCFHFLLHKPRMIHDVGARPIRSGMNCANEHNGTRSKEGSLSDLRPDSEFVPLQSE